MWQKGVGQVADVAAGGCEAGPGAGRRPMARVVQAQVPGARAAHREAAEDVPAVVERAARSLVALQERMEYLPQVLLAGPTVGVVAPAEKVELDVVLVRRRWFAAEG